MADRTQEHLGESDRGVILMRKRLLEEAEKVRNGEEPKSIIRDPKAARFVELPIVGRDFYPGWLFDARRGRRQERISLSEAVSSSRPASHPKSPRRIARRWV